MATHKTTSEIRALLINAEIDFDSVENRALNDFLPKIFHICPFTDEPCITKQCVECEVFKNYANKRDSKGEAEPLRNLTL
jgi:hypothetical protein